MSLVDYASSDEDVPDDKTAKPENPGFEELQSPKDEPQLRSSPVNQQILVPNQPSESDGDSSLPSVELPDASLLLNSPTSSSHSSGNDHSSRVAAAMAANAFRKRETNVLSSSLPRSKVPRSTLPHSKNIPDTVGRVLVPPQLAGRSNIVTEDISKLFVKKSSKPSSQ